MPAFDIKQEMLRSAEMSNEKSIRFAHGFDVNLNPSNSGEWTTIDNFRVWTLTIHSDSALSLSVIFKNYRIPDGSRLFVYNRDKKVVLGAFTSQNNKPYKRLAIHPIPGDEITLQYEEPKDVDFSGELEIVQINHDFLGVTNLKNRWSRRPSGSCNVDVNCEFESELEDQKRSVVRIIAPARRGDLLGAELGTGTLINNTSNNGNPYLISAFHVFDHDSIAEITLYDFNYESPFCTKLEGYDLQSVSGSTAVASSDSLDFMLVELSEMPPASYRPYFSGWSAINDLPLNCYTIHHPNGDVKKISHDTGICDSLTYGMFKEFGHWKVNNWETGTTEGGSSGAGLFDNNKRLVGTLSGGNATCSENSYDAFVRFNKMWNSYEDPKKQLKIWLDPEHLGVNSIDGFDPYKSESEECTVISNFQVEDKNVVLPTDLKNGSYTGNNKMGITEIAERFTNVEYGTLNGIALGIKKFDYNSINPKLIVRVYSGDSLPQFAEKQYVFSLFNITERAMNYFSFNQPLKVEGNFFIGIVLPNGNDSIQFYQSKFRNANEFKSFFINQDNVWKNLSELDSESSGASLLMQVNICSASIIVDVDSTDKDDRMMSFYPNPASNYLVVEMSERKSSFELSIYDMSGRLLSNECYSNSKFEQIDVANLKPGIYILTCESEGKKESKRFIVN